MRAHVAAPRQCGATACEPWDDRSSLPPAAQLLTEGGDARITVDAGNARNQYGCTPLPDPGLVAFGSATASVISGDGLAAAERLRQRLLAAHGTEAAYVTYARELDRLRRELTAVCGVADIAGLGVVFAASGTDLHLIASQLIGHSVAKPALAVMMDAAETGSQVPGALAGRHLSTRTPLGTAVGQGMPISGAHRVEVTQVPIRRCDGTPRTQADIDGEVESLVTRAAAEGRHVLLILLDVSKTGMIAPAPECVAALRRRLPNAADVLVDACQWRIAPSTLRAYLAFDFMVALTGSKFVGGPPFSGALFVPPSTARRLCARPLPCTLRAYSSMADWPHGWVARQSLERVVNYGMLLRWEAALQELRAFSAVPPTAVAEFLETFSYAVQTRLRSDPAFEPLPAPRLERRPLIHASDWDLTPTIFPFLLHRTTRDGGRTPLSHEETARVHRLLQTDLSGRCSSAAGSIPHEIAAARFQLGQPVHCGVRAGIRVSALRLCAGARSVVEAAASGAGDTAHVIERALAALDKAAMLV